MCSWTKNKRKQFNLINVRFGKYLRIFMSSMVLFVERKVQEQKPTDRKLSIRIGHVMTVCKQRKREVKFNDVARE